MLTAARAPADRGRRRHHQRRRVRAAGGAGRTAGRAGHPHPDGLGRHPRRPPAAWPAWWACRPRTATATRPCWPPTSSSASATAGPTATPAAWTPTRRAASSCTSTSSPPRSAACSPRTWASPPTPARRWRAWSTLARERKAAGTLPDYSGWAAECAERKATMHRKTHFENIPIKPQRVYEEMNKAFGKDTTYVSTIGLSQIAGAQMLHVFGPRQWINAGQAGPLGWTAPAALGVVRGKPDADRRRPVRRLRFPVHDRGTGRRRAVQPAVHPRGGQQLLPGPDPPVPARLQHGTERVPGLREHQLHRTLRDRKRLRRGPHQGGRGPGLQGHPGGGPQRPGRPPSTRPRP